MNQNRTIFFYIGAIVLVGVVALLVSFMGQNFLWFIVMVGLGVIAIGIASTFRSWECPKDVNEKSPSRGVCTVHDCAFQENPLFGRVVKTVAGAIGMLIWFYLWYAVFQDQMIARGWSRGSLLVFISLIQLPFAGVIWFLILDPAGWPKKASWKGFLIVSTVGSIVFAVFAHSSSKRFFDPETGEPVKLFAPNSFYENHKVFDGGKFDPETGEPLEYVDKGRADFIRRTFSAKQKKGSLPSVFPGGQQKYLVPARPQGGFWTGPILTPLGELSLTINDANPECCEEAKQNWRTNRDALTVVVAVSQNETMQISASGEWVLMDNNRDGEKDLLSCGPNGISYTDSRLVKLIKKGYQFSEKDRSVRILPEANPGALIGKLNGKTFLVGKNLEITL